MNTEKPFSMNVVYSFLMLRDQTTLEIKNNIYTICFSALSESVGKETVVIRFPGNSSVSASSIHSNGLQDPSASVSVSYLWQHISLEQSGRTVFIAVLKVFQETSRDLKPSTGGN